MFLLFLFMDVEFYFFGNINYVLILRKFFKLEFLCVYYWWKL